MWRPFRVQDLNRLHSEERLCSVSEHRCTSSCTEKALWLLPTKQVERNCHIFTVSNATPCAPQWCCYAARKFSSVVGALCIQTTDVWSTLQREYILGYIIHYTKRINHCVCFFLNQTHLGGNMMKAKKIRFFFKRSHSILLSSKWPGCLSHRSRSVSPPRCISGGCFMGADGAWSTTIRTPFHPLLPAPTYFAIEFVHHSCHGWFFPSSKWHLSECRRYPARSLKKLVSLSFPQSNKREQLDLNNSQTSSGRPEQTKWSSFPSNISHLLLSHCFATFFALFVIKKVSEIQNGEEKEERFFFPCLKF